MEIGAYLCFSGFLWLLGLAFNARLRQRLGVYSALGCITPPIALFLYFFVAAWLGIYGNASAGTPNPVSWRTYVERGGAFGTALLLLYVVGAFWPIVAAWILSRRSARPTLP
jgi:hypothetical protein